MSVTITMTVEISNAYLIPKCAKKTSICGWHVSGILVLICDVLTNIITYVHIIEGRMKVQKSVQL